MTTIITGAHRGLGYERLLAMHVDLADLASVRAFAGEFRACDLAPLTTIICNASISKPTVRERSATWLKHRIRCSYRATSRRRGWPIQNWTPTCPPMTPLLARARAR